MAPSRLSCCLVGKFSPECAPRPVVSRRNLVQPLPSCHGIVARDCCWAGSTLASGRRSLRVSRMRVRRSDEQQAGGAPAGAARGQRLPDVRRLRSPARLLRSHDPHRRQGPQRVFRARGTRHAGGPPARGRAAPLRSLPGEENRLVRLLEESETEMHPRYERLCQEMIALTCYPGPHTADSLARRMFRNKQQIQSDLRWWQGMLESERAHAVRRPPDHRRGPRVDRAGLRHVHAVLVLHRPRCAGASCPRCSDRSSPYDRQFLERCIAEMQRDLGFEFSSNAQWQFGVYLCIMVTRLRLGHGLTCLARRGRGHAVLRLPQEAARAPLLA